MNNQEPTVYSVDINARDEIEWGQAAYTHTYEVLPSASNASWDLQLLISTTGDICATGTYLIFLLSSNKQRCYFSFKNNTRIFFLP